MHGLEFSRDAGTDYGKRVIHDKYITSYGLEIKTNTG
jgi:hypothetical protein